MNDFERLIKLLQDNEITFEADCPPRGERRKIQYSLEGNTFYYYFDKFGVLRFQDVKNENN